MTTPKKTMTPALTTGWRKLKPWLAALVLLPGAVLSSRAQNVYWNGTVDVNWTTAGNWFNSVTPTAGTTVNYNNTSTANLANELLGANASINGIVIGSPAGPVSILAGNTLTNYGNLDLSAATVNFTLAANQVYSNNPTWTIGGNGELFTNSASAINIGSNTLTINVVSASSGVAYITQNSIGGTGGRLIKLGAGTVDGGGGSYTGGAAIDQGTFFMLNNNFGANWTPVVVCSNALVNFNGKQTFNPLFLTNGIFGTGRNGNFDSSNIVSSGASTIGVSEMRIGVDAANGNYTTVFDVEDGTLILNINKLYDTSTATGSVLKVGAGTLFLTNLNINPTSANSYKGTTTISNGVLQVLVITNGGVDSYIGRSGNAASNLVLNGGTLRYSGVASASDRLFSIGMNNGGGTLDASGTGALSLTNVGAMGFVDSGPHTLTLTGTNVGNNILSAAITDNGGPTSILKTGPGQWILKGTNTATGGLMVSNGSLLIGGSLVLATATNVNVPSGTGFGIYNSQGANLPDRIPDSAPVILNGSSFSFINDGSANNFSETVGALVLNSGSNNVTVGAAPIGHTSILTFSSLTNLAPGSATLNFQVTDLASTRILFSTPPANYSGYVTINQTNVAFYDPVNGFVVPGAYVGIYGTNFFTGGDAGEGLDLNGSDFAYAEYYGGYDPMDYAGAANNLLPIQNAVFDYGADYGTTVAGNDLGPSGNGTVSPNGGNDPFTTQPNFGSDENDTNTAWICNTYMQANTADINFAVPTVNGQNYKLQLMFHDAFLSGSGKRVMTVTIGSQLVVPSLDLGALGCTINSPKGYVVSYNFTGNGGVLPVTIHSTTPATGPAILNGLTLEVLNGSEVPHFILAPQNQTQILGLNTTFSVLAAGGTNNAISYQWYYANAPITGATNNTFTLTNVTAGAAGQYAVVASNSSGSATNTATLTVDTTKSTSLVLVTGPDPGEGLNLNGNIVMAQYFGNHTGPNLPIGGALFTPSTIAGGTEGGGNLPSFGSSTFDRNLATLSYYSTFAGTLDFTIPTTNGVQYRLQLILHDNFYDSPGSRIFNVKVGGNVLVPNLDLAALKAGKTNAVDVAVIYTFTGDGNPLDVNLAASLNNAIFCAFTLEDLSSAPSAPAILVPVGTQVAGQGATVQLSVSASGGGLAYQWQQMVNGTYVNLTDGGNISGSTSNILTIAGVTAVNSTNYNVLISNISGATNSSGNLVVLTTAPAMIGHWLAGGMNLADSSGYAPAGTHDGFFVGDNSQVWSTDVPTNLPSFAGGYSLDLSAGNAAVAITNTVISDLNYAPTFDTLISNSFSVAVWIKGWPLTQYDPFLSKKGENTANGAAGFQLRQWYSYTYPTFTVQSGVGPELNNPNLNIVDSRWHHLVGTRNATTGIRKLYVDSVLVASFTNDFAPMPASVIDHLMLGGKQSDGGGYGNWAQVKLYDARMYNYALTLPQVSSLNGITNPPILTSPVATQAAVAGDNVQFSVNASGIGLSYQWQKLVGGSYVNLTDGGNVSGSTSNILSLAGVSTSDDGSYQAIVSNVMGQTNAPANLDVVSPAPGLVGHWLAGAMNLTDSSGFTAADTHDGFFVGDGSQAWSTDVPTNLPSFAGGYSLDLSAGSAAVAITNSASGDLHYYTTFDRLLTNTFTVAAWVKGWPIINYGAFVAKKGESTVNGTNGFQLRQWYTNSYPTFTAQSGVGPELYNTNINIANTGWHHLVGTRNASTGVRSLYVDSVLVASYTNDFAALPFSMTDHLTLGCKQSDGNYGNWSQVKLFDVRVYNYQLSSSQIQAVNGIVPPPPTPTNPTPIAFTLANGQLTMNWTNGVLESTTNLAGNNWMIEVVSNPPVTIPISTSGNKFYRVISQ